MVLSRSVRSALFLSAAVVAASCGDGTGPEAPPDITSVRVWHSADSVFAEARASHAKGIPDLTFSGDFSGVGAGSLRVSLPREVVPDSREYSLTVSAVLDGLSSVVSRSHVIPGVPLGFVDKSWSYDVSSQELVGLFRTNYEAEIVCDDVGGVGVTGLSGVGEVRPRLSVEQAVDDDVVPLVCEASYRGVVVGSGLLSGVVPRRPVRDVSLVVEDVLGEVEVDGGSLLLPGGRSVSLEAGVAVLSESDSVFRGLVRVGVFADGFYSQSREVVVDGDSAIVSFDVMPAGFDLDQYYDFMYFRNTLCRGGSPLPVVNRWPPGKPPTFVLYRDVYTLNEDSTRRVKLLPNDTLSQEWIDSMRLRDVEIERILSIVREDLPLYLPYDSVRVVMDDEMHPDSISDISVHIRDRKPGFISIFRYTNVPPAWAIAHGQTCDELGYLENAILALQLPSPTHPAGGIRRVALAADINQSFGWLHRFGSSSVQQALMWYVEDPDGSNASGRPRELLIRQGKILYSDSRPIGSFRREWAGVLYDDFIPARKSEF